MFKLIKKVSFLETLLLIQIKINKIIIHVFHRIFEDDILISCSAFCLSLGNNLLSSKTAVVLQKRFLTPTETIPISFVLPWFSHKVPWLFKVPPDLYIFWHSFLFFYVLASLPLKGTVKTLFEPNLNHSYFFCFTLISSWSSYSFSFSMS